MEPIQLPPVHRNQGGKSLDEGPKGGVLKEQIVKKLEALNKQQTDWLQPEEMNEFNPWPGLWFWSVCLDWGYITVKA